MNHSRSLINASPLTRRTNQNLHQVVPNFQLAAYLTQEFRLHIRIAHDTADAADVLRDYIAYLLVGGRERADVGCGLVDKGMGVPVEGIGVLKFGGRGAGVGGSVVANVVKMRTIEARFQEAKMTCAESVLLLSSEVGCMTMLLQPPAGCYLRTPKSCCREFPCAVRRRPYLLDYAPARIVYIQRDGCSPPQTKPREHAAALAL